MEENKKRKTTVIDLTQEPGSAPESASDIKSQPTKRRFIDLTDETPNEPYDDQIVSSHSKSFPYADLPVEILELIFSYLSTDRILKILQANFYVDIARCMMTDPLSFRLALEWIRRHTSGNLSRGTYWGIFTILQRYSPSLSLRDETLLNEQSYGQLRSYRPEFLEEIIRAIGWRKYSCRLRLNQREFQNRISLTELNSLIITHARLTSSLRSQSSRELYPQKWWEVGSKQDSEQRLDKALVTKLVGHWKSIYECQNMGHEKNYHELDKLAYSIAQNESLMKNGHNLSVADCQSHKMLFSNRELDPTTTELIKNGYDIELSSYCSATGRQNWNASHGIDRKNLGRKSGHLPYHSEMQRLEHEEPWQLGYCGNNYLSCVQCLAGYFAIGVSLFRGSHMGKAPSIVPSKIKLNSVYLEQYLGEDLFEQFKTGENISELLSFIDFVERYDQQFYRVYDQIVTTTGLTGGHSPPSLIRRRSPAPRTDSGDRMPVSASSVSSRSAASPNASASGAGDGSAHSASSASSQLPASFSQPPAASHFSGANFARTPAPPSASAGAGGGRPLSLATSSSAASFSGNVASSYMRPTPAVITPRPGQPCPGCGRGRVTQINYRFYRFGCSRYWASTGKCDWKK